MIVIDSVVLGIECVVPAGIDPDQRIKLGSHWLTTAERPVTATLGRGVALASNSSQLRTYSAHARGAGRD